MNVLDKRDKSLAPTPNAAPADKVEKFKWAKPTTPGKFAMVNKNLLNIDDRYQRNQTSSEAVKRIARDWDWSLFPTLMVAKRTDGTLWIFDGGHRARASFFRADIIELPCLIFEWEDVSDEARAFIGGAKMRLTIGAVDTFRAATVAMEPNSCRTATILHELGITVKKTVSGGSQLKCIGAVKQAVQLNEQLAKRCLQMCLDIAGEHPIQRDTFSGLFTLANHFNGEDILTVQRDKILALSQQEIEKAIRQYKAITGKGGEVSSAKAILELVNKGKRNKLVW